MLFIIIIIILLIFKPTILSTLIPTILWNFNLPAFDPTRSKAAFAETAQDYAKKKAKESRQFLNNRQQMQTESKNRKQPTGKKQCYNSDKCNQAMGQKCRDGENKLCNSLNEEKGRYCTCKTD